MVHGIRGERHRYRPVKSCLTHQTDPLSVASALQQETECREFYVADLNALQRRGDNLSAIGDMAGKLSAVFWVDAGIKTAADALRVISAGAGKVIICTETLPGVDHIDAINNSIPSEKLMCSIDIVKGHVLSKTPLFNTLPPLDVVEVVAGHGLKNFILLSLDQVGTGSGLDLAFYREASRRFPQLSFIAGGGIRSAEDIETLAPLNIRGVLVATALHKGWITGRHIRAVEDKTI